VAYLVAVIKNCGPQSKACSERSVRPAVAHFPFTPQQLEHLTSATANSSQSAHYVRTWAGLEVVRCHLEGGNCNGAACSSVACSRNLIKVGPIMREFCSTLTCRLGAIPGPQP
jgi:hypothetical protein